MTRLHLTLLAALVLAAGPAALPAQAQTSTTTTTTRSSTQSTTTTNTWRSPDGSQERSKSTTNSTTRSQSLGITIGTPGPGQSGQRPVVRPDAEIGYGLVGSWRIRIGKRSCGLTLYKGFNPNGGGATTQGCASGDLADIGNWILQGQSLTLTKSMIVPVASLRRRSFNRFDGTTRAGERITISR